MNHRTYTITHQQAEALCSLFTALPLVYTHKLLEKHYGEEEATEIVHTCITLYHSLEEPKS